MSSTCEKIISLYPQVMFFVLLIICYTYHLSYSYALIGYIGNSIVNGVLKQSFRSLIGNEGNRPVPYHSSNMFDNLIVLVWPEHANNHAYGFPSGHAQSIGYFLAFVHEFLWKRWNSIALITVIMTALCLMYTRILYNRHTFNQVLFGFLFGVATFHAFHWYWTS